MNPPLRSLLHPLRYRIAATLLGVVALIALYAQTQSLDLQRHNALLADFSQLKGDEARLGETVMRLNYNLANNYDEVNAILQHMHATAALLRTPTVIGQLGGDHAFQQQIRLLDRRLAEKTDALERFKSRNAQLKNSLIYLPLALREVLTHLPAASPEHEKLQSMVMHVFIRHLRGLGATGEPVTTDMPGILAIRKHYPAALQSQFDRMLRHIQLIDAFEKDMPGLLASLVDNDSGAQLEVAYRNHFERQQQDAALYRLLLLAAALLLLGYAAVTFRSLRDNARQLRLAASVFANASDSFIITDSRSEILDVNPAFERVTGYRRGEVLGNHPRLLKSGRHDAAFYKSMWETIARQGRWQGEIWSRRKNGEIYPTWLTITAVTRAGGVVSHYIGASVDITERKRGEAEIHHLAFFDPLTQLPNRRLLIERLGHALHANARTHSRAALLFIDLDYFKTLNDTRGHDIGDLLLQDVARRLQECVRESDTVARLGGDEFVVILENLSHDPEHAAAQAMSSGEKIQAVLKRPYLLGDLEYYCSCSIGISLFDGQDSVEELLKRADTAMYEAKNAGRNTLRFFDPEMQRALEAKATLEADLRQAIEHDQLQLHCQVQVDASGHPVGAEALLRWTHPRHGEVAPDVFIPLAEESDLIVLLGRWVLHAACAKLRRWQDLPHMRHLRLAINISARQLRDKSFVEDVEQALQAQGIAPSMLALEITESMLLHEVEAVIDIMHKLKQLGIRFSLDDFGTGYSSLQYLKQLPLDEIKIDRSFVRSLTAGSNDEAIVRTIILMATSLGMDILAEGVETAEQHAYLSALGCVLYQGFLFGHAVPDEVFESRLAAEGTKTAGPV